MSRQITGVLNKKSIIQYCFSSTVFVLFDQLLIVFGSSGLINGVKLYRIIQVGILECGRLSY